MATKKPRDRVGFHGGNATVRGRGPLNRGKGIASVFTKPLLGVTLSKRRTNDEVSENTHYKV